MTELIGDLIADRAFEVFLLDGTFFGEYFAFVFRGFYLDDDSFFVVFEAFILDDYYYYYYYHYHHYDLLDALI